MSHAASYPILRLISPNAIGDSGAVIETTVGPLRVNTGSGNVALTNDGLQFLPKTNPIVIWEMDPSQIPGYTAGQVVETRSTLHIYANDPAPNPFVGFGIWSANVGLNGTRIEFGREAFALRYEDNWKNPTLPGTTTDTEFHIQFQDNSSSLDTWYRAFSASFINENLLNSLSVGLSGEIFRFYRTHNGPTLEEWVRWAWQDAWGGGSSQFYFTMPTGVSYDYFGGGDVNGGAGSIHLYPSSSGNFKIKLDFGGGSGEIARFVGVNGHQPTWMVLGPSDDSRGEIWCYNVGPNTGLAVGFGVVPTAVDASPVASRLYLKDGASIKLDGTTTGLTILTGATQKLGFYGAAPQAQLTVTGAKGGNAALTSLITQLAALGLVVDGTS